MARSAVRVQFGQIAVTSRLCYDSRVGSGNCQSAQAFKATYSILDETKDCTRTGRFHFFSPSKQKQPHPELVEGRGDASGKPDPRPSTSSGWGPYSNEI